MRKTKIITYNVFDYFIVKATVEVEEPAWVEFIVEDIQTQDMEGNTLSTEPYLDCTIKWDGCSHFRFGDEKEKDGYLHLCGAFCFKNHMALMEWLYKKAEYLMNQDTVDKWEDATLRISTDKVIDITIKA